MIPFPPGAAAERLSSVPGVARRAAGAALSFRSISIFAAKKEKSV